MIEFKSLTIEDTTCEYQTFIRIDKTSVPITIPDWHFKNQKFDKGFKYVDFASTAVTDNFSISNLKADTSNQIIDT